MARVFSGIKPTADAPHLGNYIGALRHWVGLQGEHECLYCVVDLHSMTVPWDPKTLRQRTLAAAATLLACGVDPERSVLFVQSDVTEHTELSWILTCLARMGELNRMTQFKDKAKGKDAGAVGAGLFTYPVLMAADVLAYRAGRVPVGDDQRQHVELMRDIAERFNREFGETFPVPEPLIATQGARIMSLDDPARKMDKSAEHPEGVIWMTDSADAVRKKLARAVTDSGRDVRYGSDKPAISNLLEMFAAVTGRSVAEVEGEYAGKGYADLKSGLTEAVVAFLAPFQERFGDLTADPEGLGKILDEGAERARAIAEETLKLVRERIGVRRP
jgi:tryptophanyl-tRNA synthetase